MPGSRTTRAARAQLRQSKVLFFSSLLIVVLLGLLTMFFIRLAASPDVKASLGPDRFELGSARKRAASIRKDGPLLFQDLRDRGRGTNIYVQHLGTDPLKGWYAFSARPPEAAERCILRWEEDDATFEDPCDGTTYPADGKGLPQYSVVVGGDDELSVDLRSSGSKSSASTPSSSTSSP